MMNSVSPSASIKKIQIYGCDEGDKSVDKYYRWKSLVNSFIEFKLQTISDIISIPARFGRKFVICPCKF
jgi:hypothetical protein